MSKAAIRKTVAEIREELRLFNEALAREDWDRAQGHANVVFERSRGLLPATSRLREKANRMEVERGG